MTVSSATSSQANAAATTTSSTTSTTTAKTMGADDFMKLLAVQFKSQDPMKPMEDTAFIAQMAQFTALSQTQTLTAEMAKLSTSQQLATANSYIGAQVTVDNGKSGTETGVVSGVQVDATNGPQILVNGKPYLVSSVILVQPAPAAATSSTTTAAAAGSS